MQQAWLIYLLRVQVGEKDRLSELRTRSFGNAVIIRELVSNFDHKARIPSCSDDALASLISPGGIFF
jgi:hypothetical protein